jgi:AbrB family looped-hinge helix DNA binding protein
LDFELHFYYTSNMQMIYGRISSKGQLVIPAELRDEMKLSGGTKVSIRREGNTLVLRPVTPEFINSLVGCTKGAGAERERIHRDDKTR